MSQSFTSTWYGQLSNLKSFGWICNEALICIYLMSNDVEHHNLLIGHLNLFCKMSSSVLHTLEIGLSSFLLINHVTFLNSLCSVTGNTD